MKIANKINYKSLKALPIGGLKAFSRFAFFALLAFVLLPKVNFSGTLSNHSAASTEKPIAVTNFPGTNNGNTSFIHSNFSASQSYFESALSPFEIEENEDNSIGKKIAPGLSTLDVLDAKHWYTLPKSFPITNCPYAAGTLFPGKEQIIGICSFRI